MQNYDKSQILEKTYFRELTFVDLAEIKNQYAEWFPINYHPEVFTKLMNATNMVKCGCFCLVAQRAAGAEIHIILHSILRFPACTSRCYILYSYDTRQYSYSHEYSCNTPPTRTSVRVMYSYEVLVILVPVLCVWWAGRQAGCTSTVRVFYSYECGSVSFSWSYDE